MSEEIPFEDLEPQYRRWANDLEVFLEKNHDYGGGLAEMRVEFDDR